MDSRNRRCGACNHLNPPTAEFCAECGVFLANVAPSSLARVQQTQFALPDYLLVARERERDERRRRMTSETGDGIGLLWIGAIAAALALWFGGGTGLGIPIFLLSLLAILVGLWRMRHDQRNMARAGAAAIITSSVVVGAALVQTVGFTGVQVSLPSRAVVATVTPLDPAEAPALAMAADGMAPMFRGNAARTGQNAGPPPARRPTVAWKAFVGGENYASPVVGLGKVFVATKSGSVLALDLRDGRELWAVDVGDYVARSTPAFDGKTLYVAAGYAMVAIDGETGQERWRMPLRFAGPSSPVVDGDFVYVATQEGHVSAFAAETGEEVWHYRNDNLLFASPALASGRLVIADETGVVTAISADQGRKVWQAKLGAEIFATPAIVNGVVYVSTMEPQFVALDLGSGKEAWRRPIGGPSSPAIANGTIYVGGNDQAIRAITSDGGKDLWTSPLGYPIESSAIISGDALFIASGPSVTALNAEDGQTLWTYVTGDTVTADLSIISGMVLASGHDGYIYALASETEKPAVPGGLRNSGEGVLLRGSR